jgi:DNA polymerase III subunit epsilon
VLSSDSPEGFPFPVICMSSRVCWRDPDSTAKDDTIESPTPPNRELLRRAREALSGQGIPLDTRTLARHIFGGFTSGAGTATAWERLTEQLLSSSSLFLPDGEGNWGLASWGGAERALGEIEFAVVDVETTGLAPGRHRIIEVGAVIVARGQSGESFSKLINPGRSIPQFITRFTGISQAMVARSARADRVLPHLAEFIGDRPIVGHNIGFDLSFLNFEADRFGLALGFAESGIDTITLARRYLTGLRRTRLDSVAAALHVPAAGRHRALPDALLTARVFALLLARAQAEGCITLADLYRVLDGVAPASAEVYSAPRPTGRMYLNPAWRQQFPTTPGVYLMKDRSGAVIYVGKAKRLRDRLASYYSQPLGYTRKMDGLLQSVHDIETRPLGSELEALLVESQLIKQLQPRYNVQLRNFEHYPFIKVDMQHPYPRFTASREVAADGARYFGPFRNARIVNATLELLQKVFPIRTCTRNLPPAAKASDPCLRYHLKRCPGPCRGVLDTRAQEEYAQVIEEACAFLGGEREDLLVRLKEQMFIASARQDFERAARLRDALRDADQVLLGQRLITGAVLANNLLIIYPSVESGHLELFLVRHGRLACQHRAAAETCTFLEELQAIIQQAAVLGAPPRKVGREEVDQINIIARWIHRHSEDEQRSYFPLPEDLTDSNAVERFMSHVAQAVLTPLDTGEEGEETETPASVPISES